MTPVRLLAPVGLLILLTAQAAAADRTDWIKQNLNSLITLYEHLHCHPELSFQEKETAARIADELRAVDVQVTTGIGGHGVVGVLNNGDGKTLLLRTDLDALPIKEETGLKFSSKVEVADPLGKGSVGVMHACGHDVHMTNFIGVARYLASHRDEWQGRIIFVAQPAEERLAGARAMFADGLYNRFGKPDFCLALHVAAELPAGTIGYRSGFAGAACDNADITVYGNGGHGASPHRANDPIVQAAQLVLALQTIVSREVDPIESAVVTVGSIHGGTAHNIIPNECELQLTLRSYKLEVRKALHDAIERKAEGIARSMGARKPRVKIAQLTDALRNDPDLVNRIVPVFQRTIGQSNVIETPPGMGSEDFAMFAQDGVPIFMFALGSVARAQLQRTSQSVGLHSSKYCPEIRPTLTTGITAMVAAACELLPP